MTKPIKLKHTVVIALLAIVLTTPAVVRAYSNGDDVQENEPQQVVGQPTVGAELIVETPVTEVAVETAVETTTETTTDDTEVPPADVVDEDETPIEEPVITEVSINDAITIAQAEHPGVEVVLAKVKLAKLGEDKVYKIAFADGWRIYVAADGGEILRIKDPSDKKHNCGDKGRNAVSAWRAKNWERKKQKYNNSRVNSDSNERRGDWKHDNRSFRRGR